jgi:SAM-dependent methyltransferase
MDLACGTGQLCFALCHWFSGVWAVDQEPDMVGLCQAKAAAAGIGTIRFVTSAAGDLAAPEQSFGLPAGLIAGSEPAPAHGPCGHAPLSHPPIGRGHA